VGLRSQPLLPADFVVEASWLRTGAYAYPSTINALFPPSAWVRTIRWPIYHAFLHAFVFSFFFFCGHARVAARALGCAIFRTDSGLSWVERRQAFPDG